MIESSGMKKTFLALIVIIIIVGGAFLYSVRPASAPTQDIQAVSDTLSATTSGSSLYRISQSESRAEFTVNEMLYGKPKLVVGTTTQIAGDITVAGNKVVIGTIKLNAKTLVTDSPQRNGALSRLILKAEDPANEFMVFVPTSNDFTGTIEAGKQISFNVTGDFTISGVTKPATFKVALTPGTDKVTGTASTTIKRSDFNLKIPNLSFIANVDDAIPVTATIVANKVSNQ